MYKGTAESGIDNHRLMNSTDKHSIPTSIQVKDNGMSEFSCLLAYF